MPRLSIPTLLTTLLLSAFDLVAQARHGGSEQPMYHGPRWSPDGNLIVVVAMSSSGSQLLIFPASGGERVTVPTGLVEPMAADWTTDGRIALVGDSAGGPSRTFVLDRDGRNLRGYSPDSITAATPDSSVLLFESKAAGSSDILAMNRRRTAPRQLTRGFWAEQATISPDGRRILFEKRIDPNDMLRSDVVTMGLDGGNQTVIAPGTDPSWSPDGALVLFKTPDESGQLWVSTVDPSTRTVRRLAKGVHPQWVAGRAKHRLHAGRARERRGRVCNDTHRSGAALRYLSPGSTMSAKTGSRRPFR
jgi:Tol biopolymer transport system component